MSISARSLAIALLATAASLAAADALAATRTWVVVSGDWATDTNWSPSGLPSLGDSLYIQNGGTANVTSADITSNLYLGNGGGAGTVYMATGSLTSFSSEIIGNSGSGTFTQQGGANSVAATLAVGDGGTSNGYYYLSAGSLSASAEAIGSAGNGLLHQTGGVNSCGNLLLAGQSSSQGQYDLNNGLLSVSQISAGNGSTTFNFNGGTLQAMSSFGTTVAFKIQGAPDTATFDTYGNTLTLNGPVSDAGSLQKIGAGTLVIASVSGYNGTTTVSGGTLQIDSLVGLTTYAEYVGVNQSASVVSSGANTMSSGLYVGYGSPGTYSLNQSGGVTSTSAPTEEVGATSPGIFTQTGGINQASSVLYVGYSSSGTYGLGGTGQLSAPSERIGYSGSGTFIQSSGTNTATASGFDNGLVLGDNGGGGSYTLNSGLLSAGNEWIGFAAVSTFTQNGGTNSVSYLSVGYYNGTYNLGSSGLLTAQTEISGDVGEGNIDQSGGTNTVSSVLTVGGLGSFGGNYELQSGQLSAPTEYIGQGKSGFFTQSGGNNTVHSVLYVGYGGPGTYYLNLGQLSAGNEYIGFSGSGSFTQTGGNNTVTSGLYLGYNPGSSSLGTYNLSAPGQLSAAAEFIGNGGDPSGGIGIFTQTGGSNTAANACINDGYYLLGGGELTVLSGGTLQVTYGGLQMAGSGALDCGGGTLTAANSLVDISNNNVLNANSTALCIGANSLLIVPVGFDPAAFQSYANLGLTHTLGTTLNVSAGTGFAGWGQITDQVNCQGMITAAPGGWINLNNGLYLSGTGQINLGSGTLTVNDTGFSGMTGGSLAAGAITVGSSGTGSFPQSGGAVSLSTLILGNNAGDSGSYALSSSGQLSVGTQVVVGLSGSGSFTQSGGTHSVASLVLAQQPGSTGTYNLNGGLLSLSALTQGSSAAAFNLGGGTFQAASPLTTSVPIYLSTLGSNGIFDTNGNALTLGGPLSGPGGLQVIGTGTLTLAVSNGYTGTTLVSGGTLALGDPNALSGSTFDTSGSGSLSFQSSIGAFFFGGLQGSGSLALTDTSSVDVALTVGGNNANTTFSGSLSDLSGSGSLTKTGTGLLILGGDDTYGGGTTVLDGTLEIASNGALLGGSSLIVGEGAMSMGGGAVPGAARAGAAQAVPEPSTLALLCVAGIIAAASWRRRRNRVAL